MAAESFGEFDNLGAARQWYTSVPFIFFIAFAAVCVGLFVALVSLMLLLAGMYAGWLDWLWVKIWAGAIGAMAAFLVVTFFAVFWWPDRIDRIDRQTMALAAEAVKRMEPQTVRIEDTWDDEREKIIHHADLPIPRSRLPKIAEAILANDGITSRLGISLFGDNYDRVRAAMLKAQYIEWKDPDKKGKGLALTEYGRQKMTQYASMSTRPTTLRTREDR